MARDTAPVEQNEYGDDVHPAFVMASVHRIRGGGHVLFDSDVVHDDAIRVTVSPASRRREHGHDYLLGHGPDLIEFDLSMAQWASLVSSMDTTGVPATLRRVVGNHRVPGLEHDPRLAHSMAEAREAAHRMMAEVREAMAALDELDSKAPAKERRTALDNLRSKIRNAGPNVEFAGKQMVKLSEDVVQKARADIDAMVTQKAAQLGVTAGRMVALPAETDVEQDDQ